MKKSKLGPNTEILCEVCKGTKINPNAHPSHNAECGACQGWGRSTNPYDQKRNATLVGVDVAEVAKHGSLLAAIQARNPDMRGIIVHDEGHVQAAFTGCPARHVGVSVSWENLYYPTALKYAKEASLYKA